MHMLSPGVTVYGYAYALSWCHCIWLCICSLLVSLYMAMHMLSPGVTVYGYAYALSWCHCIWICICPLLVSLYMAMHMLSLGVTVYGYAPATASTGISLCSPAYLDNTAQLSCSLLTCPPCLFLSQCLNVVDAQRLFLFQQC